MPSAHVVECTFCPAWLSQAEPAIIFIATQGGDIFIIRTALLLTADVWTHEGRCQKKEPHPPLRFRTFRKIFMNKIICLEWSNMPYKHYIVFFSLESLGLLSPTHQTVFLDTFSKSRVDIRRGSYLLLLNIVGSRLSALSGYMCPSDVPIRPQPHCFLQTEWWPVGKPSAFCPMLHLHLQYQSFILNRGIVSLFTVWIVEEDHTHS